MKFISKLFLLFSCLITGSVQATNAPTTNDMMNHGIFEAMKGGCEAGGFAFQWALEAIYGPGACTNGESLSAFADLIGLMNVVSMAFVIIVSGYALIIAIVKAAGGDRVGSNLMSVWYPIRIILGAGLLMPYASGWLSHSQHFVMELQIKSAAVSQYSYEYMIDRITSADSTQPKPSVSGQLITGMNRLKMLSCVNALTSDKIDDELTEQAYLTVYFGDNKTEIIKVDGMSQTQISALKNRDRIEKIVFGADQRCGVEEFRWNTADYSKNNIFSSVAFSSADLKREIAKDVSRVITDHVLDQYVSLLPIAKATSSMQADKPFSFPKGVVTAIGGMSNFNRLKNLQLANKSNEVKIYAETLLDIFTKDGIELSENVAKTFEQSNALQRWGVSAKQATWILMGIYYLDTAEVLGLPQSYMSYSTNGITPPEVKMCKRDGFVDELIAIVKGLDDDECDLVNILSSNINAVDGLYNYTTSIADKYLRDKTFEVGNGVKKKHSELFRYDLSRCTSSQCAKKNQEIMAAAEPMVVYTEVMHSSVVSSLLDFFGGDRDMFYTKSALNMPNPIIVAKQIGQVTDTISTALQATAVMSLVTHHVLEAVPFLKAGSGIFLHVYNFAWETSMDLSNVAIFYGHFIPMMPTLAWLTAIIGVFKTLMQATIAIPMASVLMALPEGEGISGTRLENLIAILLAVMLRAPLSVVGFFGSIYLGNVIFGLANAMFLMGNQINLLSFTGFFAFITMYALLLIYVITESIKFMNDSVSAVLGAISAGAGHFGNASSDAADIASESNANRAANAVKMSGSEAKQKMDDLSKWLGAKIEEHKNKGEISFD